MRVVSNYYAQYLEKCFSVDGLSEAMTILDLISRTHFQQTERGGEN